MIRPGEIQSIAGKKGVRDTQIEKDYVISWIIFGIANNQYLKENLVFKGGTVLKKVYFPDYRFSEDLDFTLLGKAPDTYSLKSKPSLKLASPARNARSSTFSFRGYCQGVVLPNETDSYDNHTHSYTGINCDYRQGEARFLS